jgi:hypothetical protein
MYSLRRTDERMRHQLLAVWLACSIIATLYSLFWDIVMDWGLASDDRWLRPVLFWGAPFVYYTAVLMNTSLRFLWILPHLLSSSWSLRMLLALMEVCGNYDTPKDVSQLMFADWGDIQEMSVELAKSGMGSRQKRFGTGPKSFQPHMTPCL